MAEWSIASVLKTEGLKGLGGSNPSLSAESSDLVLFETIYNSYLWLAFIIGCGVTQVSELLNKHPMRSFALWFYGVR